MAIVKVMTFKGIGKDKYDAIQKELGLDKPNGEWPKGVIAHIAGSSGKDWEVIDVWESEALFQAFMTQKLMPAFQKVGGIPMPEAREFPVAFAHGLPVPATR